MDDYKLILTKTLVIIFSMLLLITNTHARADEITQKKLQLSQLQKKIDLLELKLNKAHNKHNILETELDKTNKQINYYLVKFKKLQKNINLKEEEITNLKAEIQALDKKLQKAQKQIAAYLVEHYKSHDMSKIKWMYGEHSIQNIDKLLVYYQYLVAANKKLLDEFKLDQAKLTSKNNLLTQDLRQLNKYKDQWQNYLQRLHNDKKYQTVLITRLSHDINKKRQTLQEYKQSQANLSKLITKLTKASVLQTKVPISQLKNKLPKPVNVNKSAIKKVNQGLIFYAKEGESVHAVSSGVVVFADWLNGYGLLIIIDHGWGFMSLYANNLELSKQVGDDVNTYEKIAKIGHSGVLPENGLYFEIRHHGKVMPPNEWLQK